MDTVSQKFFIKLDQQTSCDYICKELQKLISKFQQKNGQDMTDSLLIIEMKNIVKTVDDTICKLEFKN
jgi:hypothetical protein